MGKTITIDDDAYKLLSSLRRRGGDSFTKVILRHLNRPADAGAELLDMKSSRRQTWTWPCSSASRGNMANGPADADDCRYHFLVHVLAEQRSRLRGPASIFLANNRNVVRTSIIRHRFRPHSSPSASILSPFPLPSTLPAYAEPTARQVKGGRAEALSEGGLGTS